MNEDKYPYIGFNSFYTVVFYRKNFGKCIESSCSYIPVGYEGYCSEDSFKKIEERSVENLKKGDLIIGSQFKGTSNVSIASNPAVHTNFLTAQKEAERLAKLDSNKNFLILEVKATCTLPSPGVVWNQ